MLLFEKISIEFENFLTLIKFDMLFNFLYWLEEMSSEDFIFFFQCIEQLLLILFCSSEWWVQFLHFVLARCIFVVQLTFCHELSAFLILLVARVTQILHVLILILIDFSYRILIKVDLVCRVMIIINPVIFTL